MTSYVHNQIIARIAAIDRVPEDRAAFQTWIKAADHLGLLADNTQEDETVIYASGEFTFVHSLIVDAARLDPLDRNDLLAWSSNPFTSAASYVWGGGEQDMWIERGTTHSGSKSLEGATNIVFGRTFEGWSGSDAAYFELNQELAHLFGIHWRPEHRAYCRYDKNGDLEEAVNITMRQTGKNDVSLVSMKWNILEEYLGISNSVLIRMFDFTLLRRENFSGWPEMPEFVQTFGPEFIARGRLGSNCCYTRGFQILRPRRKKSQLSASLQGAADPDEGKRYVEFEAYDWRNQRQRKISTDPTATTNYFEARGNTLPFELSPAFFRPEVLLKYKTDRDKYTLGERELTCRSAWYMKGFDINDAGQVHAYICDLRSLPYAEQLHWLSYNERQKSGISQRAYTNDFEGEFVTFAHPLRDIVATLRRWSQEKAFWWTLRDYKLLERVSLPVTSSIDEWGDSIHDLSKLVVEGFETKSIRKLVDARGISHDPTIQSLGLLRLALRDEKGDAGLDGLREVQLIRTKVKGHAAGEEARKIFEGAIATHGKLSAHFEHLCSLVLRELRAIEEVFRSDGRKN